MGKVEALAEGTPDNVVKRLAGIKMLKDLTKSFIQDAYIHIPGVMKKLAKNGIDWFIMLPSKLTENLVDHSGVFTFVS
ncbi:hypothetical protein ACKWMY_13800 [Serratia sp. J2]|uniref:hypothetical protein n=1 Tax=Serratia sp. J2 TaxID=3386551 RepID=UPI003916E15A